MRRFPKRMFFLLLALSLLTLPALADFGPKPQLTVRVEHPPEELYYLDLLAEGAYEGHTYGSGDSPYSGLDWSYSAQELAALDQDLLDALRSAVPEGWHACTAEGTNGAPMWGDLAGEPGNGAMVHTFGYLGVPPRYRLLLVTASGEVWLSDVTERHVLQASAVVNWPSRTLTTPPSWVAYAIQFLATLLPTLAIEGLLLPLFGFSWKKARRPFLLVNLGTQAGLFLLLGAPSIWNGQGMLFTLLFFPAEAVVLVVETLLYRRFLGEDRPARATLYGITANLCSAAAGWYLAGPLWDFIVSIS